MGAVAYLIEDCLFTGDVLFGAGCGRVFEGSAKDMVEGLDQIRGLSDETKVYFGHEYTRNNLRYATYIEPDNMDVKGRIKMLGECSTPSTLALEKAINPFLRLDEPAMIEIVNKRVGRKVIDRVERFGLLREWKNQFDDGV